MASCYLPVLEKLRSKANANIHSSSNSTSWVENSKVQTVQSKLGRTRQLQTTSSSSSSSPRPIEAPCSSTPSSSLSSRPVGVITNRDDRGVTLSQGVGSFPNNVTLQFRHDHPTLGLSDVAYQREHQSHRMTPAQYEALQRKLTTTTTATSSSANSSFSSSSSSQSNHVHSHGGVLSLGLPSNLTLFKKRPRKHHHHHHQQRPHPHDDDEDETDLELAELNDKMKNNPRRRSLPRRLNKLVANARRRPNSAHGKLSNLTSALKAEDEGFTEEDEICSGGELAPVVPPRSAFPPNRGRPPKHLMMPRTFSPCPPTKMHPPMIVAATAFRASYPGKSNKTQRKKNGRLIALDGRRGFSSAMTTE